MTRHYDNERIGKDLKRKLRYRGQRRAVQGYRYSTDEPDENFRKFFKHKFTRQDTIEFTDDPESCERSDQ